jgi:PBP1b-binding outer membrane lipoprotein LpoB
MRRIAPLLLGALVMAGCSSTPSDAQQQEMVKEWSPENIAKEYEKKGMQKEADEVRRSAQQDQN